MTQSRFYDLLTFWLADADEVEVARFLARQITDNYTNNSRGERIAGLVETTIARRVS